MKRTFLLSIITCCLLFTSILNLRAQVVVTSSDSLSCTQLCTTLSAIVTGDAPTNSGITIDDEYSSIHPIGFPFNFYGTVYNDVVIGPNGTLCFDLSLAGAYDPWPISAVLLGNSSKYNNICGPWCDIDISIAGGGTITYSLTGIAPFRKYIVTFCNDAMFSCTTQRTSTQIIIYETTNIIECHIATKPVCAGWNSGRAIIGVQNATGTAATVAPGRDFPSVYTCTNEAWRFTPDATVSSYTVSSIPYAPVPYASSLVYWYNVNTGAFMGTGSTMTVCPTTTTTYKAGALGCADTSFGYYTVTPSPAFTLTLTPTDPTRCESCDGTILVSGFLPNLPDTLTYTLGGVPQPTVIGTASPSGTVLLTGLCAGTYDNFVGRQGSCASIPAGPVTLSNPSIAISSVTTSNPSICGACDGSLTLAGLYPSHAFTVSFTKDGVPQPTVAATTTPGGTITLSGLCSGTYTNIVAQYGVTCITPPMGPYTLTDPAISISSVDITQPSLCGACDGALTLHGLYPFHIFTINYTKDGIAQPAFTGTTDASGSITLSGLCEATYANITAGYTSVCVTPPVGPYVLAGPPPPPAYIISFTHPTECGLCNGTMRLKAVTPFSSDTIRYSFNGVPQTPFATTSAGDSSIFLPGLCDGLYSGMSVKIGGCVTTVIGTADLIDPPLTASFDTTFAYGCSGDTVFFHNHSTSPGPLYYVWDFGDGHSDTSTNPYHVYGPGTYTVSLLATNHHCADYDTLVFTVGHPLEAIFTPTPALICQKESVSFNNTSIGATSYAWSFGDGGTDNTMTPSHTFNISNSYNVRLIVGNTLPCYDTAYAIVQVDTISGAKISLTDSVLCSGTYITLTGHFASLGNTGVTWTFGDTGDSIKNTNPVYHAFGGQGVYTVSVNAHFRVCPDVSTTRTVSVYDRPIISIGADTSICKGSEAIMIGDLGNLTNPAASWVWNTGERTKTIRISAPGTYYAKATVNGCEVTDSITVTDDCYVHIPNVFTPNGDGVNDFFFPRQLLAKGLTNFNMAIYNRWGQTVFETTSLSGAGWDGRLNGIEQPEGVYVYTLEAEFRDGQHESHKGNVTLMR